MKKYKHIALLLCISMIFHMVPVYAKEPKTMNQEERHLNYLSNAENESEAVVSTSPAINTTFPAISATPVIITTLPAISTKPVITTLPLDTTKPVNSSPPAISTVPVESLIPSGTTQPPETTKPAQPTKQPSSTPSITPTALPEETATTIPTITPEMPPLVESPQPTLPVVEKPKTLQVVIVNTIEESNDTLSTVYIPKNEKITLRAVISGEADLSAAQYQWYQDGEILSGQMTDTFVLTGDVGQHTYTCNVVLGERTGTAAVSAFGYIQKIKIAIGNKYNVANIFGDTNLISANDITDLKVITKKAKKSFKLKNGAIQPIKYYSKSKISLSINGRPIVITVQTLLPKVQMKLYLKKNKTVLQGIPKALGASKIEFQYQIRNSKKWGNNALVSGKFKKPNVLGRFKNPTPILIKKYRVRAIYKTETGKKIYTKWTILKI